MNLRLADLHPQFLKHELDGIDTYVNSLIEATGILFICPVCYVKNNGYIGTHMIIVTFKNKNVPDNLGSHNRVGQPTRWQVSGTGYNDLTLYPSIDISEDTPGEWHGFITNGIVT